MEIKLIKQTKKYGFIRQIERFIRDSEIICKIEGVESGTLIVGKRSYHIVGGKTQIPETEIIIGSNAVTVTTEGNESYKCGYIVREGRFLTAKNYIEEILDSCICCIEILENKYSELFAKVDKIDKEYGISII